MLENNDYQFIDQIMTMSIEEGDVKSVLDLFARFTNTTVAYIDKAEVIKKFSANSSDEFCNNIRMYPTEEIMRIYMHFPVIHCEELIGIIVIDLAPNAAFPLISFIPSLANALIICRIYGKSDKISYISEDELIGVLLTGKQDDINLYKNHFIQRRMDVNGTFCAVVIYIDIAPNEVLQEFIGLLFERFCGVVKCFPLRFIGCVRDQLLIFNFMAHNDEIIETVVGNFREIAKSESIDKQTKLTNILIGVGESICGVDKFLLSYKQAIYAIKYSVMSKQKYSLCKWASMAVHCDIASMSDCTEHLARSVKVLKPLIEYDFAHKGKCVLFSTLTAFVLSFWNIKLSAKLMHLHYNSIIYRSQTIEKVLGLDLSSPSVQFDLSLIVRIYLFSLSLDEIKYVCSHFKD